MATTGEVLTAAASSDQASRPSRTETVERLEPAIARLALRYVLADIRLCGRLRADRASYIRASRRARTYGAGSHHRPLWERSHKGDPVSTGA